MSVDESTTSFDPDSIEIPEDLPEGDRTWVAQIANIGFRLPPQRLQDSRKARNLPVQAMFNVDWKPLNFKFDFNPAVFTDNPNNHQREWYPVWDNDGNLLGNFTSFGKVKAAFKELGYSITKNEVFQPKLLGKIFRVKNVVEEYAAKGSDGNPVIDPATGQPKVNRSYTVVPVEQLDSYAHPGELRTVRRGYTGAGGAGIAKQDEPTSEQIAALKAVLNGKDPLEFTDALLESGNPAVMCDPFIAEAADGELAARLIAAGGKLISGKIFFAEG